MDYRNGIDDYVGKQLEVRPFAGFMPISAQRAAMQMLAGYNAMPVHNDWDWNDNAEQSSVKGAIKRLGDAVERWAYTMPEWAARGVTPANKPYDWKQWQEHGDFLRDEIKSMFHDFDDTELSKQLADTGRITVATLQDYGNKALDIGGGIASNGLIWAGAGALLAGFIAYKLK